MERQHVYRDGQWWDTWNDTSDASPYPNPDYDWPESIVMDNWCGCGQPKRVLDAMRSYLASFEDRGTDARFTPMFDDLATLMIAYRADELGLTEHGSSIFGAWLTDAGSRWLALDAAARVQNECNPQQGERDRTVPEQA